MTSDFFGVFNLSYDGGFIDLSYDGGVWAQSAPPPIFICENNRKGNKIKHCVDLFFLSGGCEDRDIFSRIYLSICNGHIRPPHHN